MVSHGVRQVAVRTIYARFDLPEALAYPGELELDIWEWVSRCTSFR